MAVRALGWNRLIGNMAGRMHGARAWGGAVGVSGSAACWFVATFGGRESHLVWLDLIR